MTTQYKRPKHRPSLPDTMTVQWLREHNACVDDRKLFADEWPEGVAVSREALARAHQIELNLDWLAKAVLPRSVYASLELEVAPIYDAFMAVRTQLEADLRARTNGVYDGDDFNAGYRDYKAKSDLLFQDYKAMNGLLLVNALWARYEQKREAIVVKKENE